MLELDRPQRAHLPAPCRKDHRPPDPGVRRLSGGGAKRDRTADLLTASQALSQLSYGPRKGTAELTWKNEPRQGFQTKGCDDLLSGARPNGWLRRATRSGRAIRRISRCDCANGRVPGVRRGRRRCGRRRGFCARYDRELRRRLAVFAGCDEQDSGGQEKADAEEREPQRRGRLFEHGWGVVVIVLELIVPVTVRFVVRIAVATHGGAYFRFSGGGQADLPKNPDFPHLCGGFAGLTLLGRGP